MNNTHNILVSFNFKKTESHVLDFGLAFLCHEKCSIADSIILCVEIHPISKQDKVV